ncbi:ribonuclease H-like domain-containing protein [Sparassis latifolia]
MTIKSPWWKLFHSDKSHYLSNNSYLNAWCCSCIGECLRVNECADRVAIARGTIVEARSTAELLKIGSDLQGVEARAAAHDQNKENHPPAPSALPFMFLPGLDSPSIPSTPHPAKRMKSTRTSFKTLPSDSSAQPWPAERQQNFAQDLCKLFISCGMAWNMADNAEMQLFMRKWVPGAKVPDRRSLSGVYLDRAFDEVESRTTMKVKGKVATGQCDGWKNVAKMSVVTSMMTVEHEAYLVRTHDMSGELKTGDRLLELVRADIKYMSEKYGVKTIGWCTDDGPDGKKMRRLLSVVMACIICVVCWSHQIQLIVGEYLTIPEILEAIVQAQEIIKWFNSHGAALDLFEKEQELTYTDATRVLALILPCVTRWTAHFLSISRLLDLSLAMKLCCARHADKLLICAGKTADVKAKALSILNTVKADEFWKKLVRIRTHLEPLAIAMNITQAPHTRLDHVLLTLANLYRIYSSPDTEDQVQSKILDSLEKRWKKADQDVFILAVFFNPYTRGRCFDRAALTKNALTAMAKRIALPLSLTDDSLGEGTFRELGEQLQMDSIEANGDTEDDHDIVASGPLILSPSSSFEATPQPRKTSIPLRALFLYPTVGASNGNDSEPGLDFYWHGGMKNYAQELAQYDLLHTIQGSEPIGTGSST